MKRMAFTVRIMQAAAAGFALLACVTPARAEDNTATTINGTTTDNAAANYNVGNTGTNNSLVITNAGKLVNCALGYVGNAASASNNWALVTGAGSLWSNSSAFYVGRNGSLNRMTVANTGMVKSVHFAIGGTASSYGNVVTLTDTGTVWDLWDNVGYVSRGGLAPGSGLVIGGPSSSSNTLNVINGAVVTNISRWDYPSAAQAALQMYGNYGTLNITNGGKVYNVGYGIAIGGTGNSLNVLGTNSLLSIGNNGAIFDCNNGTIAVADGASVIGASSFYMPWAAGTNMQLIVRNGGTFTDNGTFVMQKPDNSVLVTDTGSVINAGNPVTIGLNRCRISAVNGGVFNGTGQFKVGNAAGNSDNMIVVTNGGRLLGPAASGNANSYVGVSGATNNGVLVRDSGYARWIGPYIRGVSNYVSVLNNSTMDVVPYGNAMNVGDTAGDLGNSVVVSNNSALNVVVATGPLTIGGTGATSNTLSVLNNSRLSMNSQTIALAGPTNNTLTIDSSSYVTNAGGFVLNQPGATVNLINNKFEGAGGPIWFSGGNLSVGSVISAGATLNVSNCVINPAGGNGGTAYIGNSGYGADSNTLNVLAGTVWNVGNQTMYVGNFNAYNWYTKGNVLNINGGVVNNAASFKVQGGNSMFNITNNGKAYCTSITLGGNYTGMGTNDIANVSGPGSLLYCGNVNTMGVYANSTAILNVLNYGTWINIYGGLEQSGSGQNANVSSGGKVYFDPYRSYNQQNALTIGRNAGDSDCNVTVTDQDSLWDMGNNLIRIASYTGAGTYCKLTVANNGAISNVTTLSVGTYAGSTSNSALATNAGVLDITTGITVGNATGYTNTLTVKQGGILQFTIASPAITITAPANSNAVVIDGGTLSYRGVSGVDLTNNWATTGVGAFRWQNASGSNTFRLNNSTANNTLGRPYVFSGSLGPTNYGRLELINGNTAINGAGGITISNDASLLVSNTYAIVQGPLTNYSGNVTLYNAMLECRSTLDNEGPIFTNVANGLISGGYQFTNVAQVIVTNGGIALQYGVISYRAVTNADVKANWIGWAGANGTTNLTMVGDLGNGFELNAATNTADATRDQSYTFSRSLGATNFAWLAIVNNGRWRNGAVTIATDGSLLITNSQATFESAVTNLGVSRTYNSTVTYQGPYAMTNGAVNQVLNSTVNYNQGITRLGDVTGGITNWIVNGNLAWNNCTVNANDLLGFAATSVWGVDTNSSAGFQVLAGGNLWISNAAYTVFTVPLTNFGYTLISPNAVLRVPSINNTGGAIANNGGFLEFTTNTTAMIVNAAGIVVTNGGVGYYGINNADVMANWTGYGSADATKDIVYQGNNLFMLDNAKTRTDVSQSYTFGQGLGATNWAGMVLVGNAAYRTLGGDTVTFTNNASLLMTNATVDYTIGNGVSNVTYNVYGTNGGGTVWSLNGTGAGVGGGLYVGSGSATGNTLNIKDASLFHSTKGCVIGNGAGANNNTVTISGTGSVWNLGGVTGSGLIIGNGGSAGNVMNVVNGAVVTNIYRFDSGLQASLHFEGNGGTLNITNGGKVYNRPGYLTGLGQTKNNNTINVIGNGSLLDNGNAALYFGDSGAMSNTLVVADGGVVANVATIYMSWSGGNDQYMTLIVTNGGKVYDSGVMILGNGGNQYNNTVTVTGTNSLLSVGNTTLGIRTNSIYVLNNGRFSLGTLTFSGVNCTMVASNNATVAASGLATIGGSTNWALITATGSVSSAGLTLSGVGNWVTITNGSFWNLNTAALTMGGGAGTTNSTLTIDSSSYVTNASAFVLNEPGRTINLISNRIEGAGGPIWFSGGNLSVGKVAFSPPATLNVSNSTINPAGGADAVYAYVGQVAGANSNTLNVLTGTVWNLGGQQLWIGAANAVGNVVNVNGGIVNNGTWIQFNGNGGTLNVTNGGKVYHGYLQNMGGGQYGAHNNTINVSGANSLLYDNGSAYISDQSNTNNVVNVFNYGTWQHGFLYVAAAGSGAVNIRSGGKVYSGGATIGGNVAGNKGFVTVSDPDSAWSVGGALTMPNAAAAVVGCVLNVANSGAVTNITTLTVGNATAVSNSVAVTNSGLLEVTTGITVGNATGYTNTLTVKQGGILQFTAASPAITVTAPANSNAVYMDGATLAYRGIQAATYPNLTNNWGAAGVGAFTWQNASSYNTYRLNNSYATNSLGRPYVFASNLGATNFARLELVNGISGLYGAGVNIDATGSILFSNTTATMWGAFTNNGKMTVANSAVTFMTNVTLLAGSTLIWSTNAPNQYVKVQGTLTLPGSMTLDVSAMGALAPGQTVMIFSNALPIGGSSPYNWTVVPRSVGAKVNGNMLMLRYAPPGTAVFFW